jgi:DNA-binding CsgD family transcriptional regulator
MAFKTEMIDRQNLTPREAEVLQLVCSAHSDKDISRLLTISLNTTIRHIEAIRKKLDVQQSELNARLALLRVAVARGIVRLGCLVLMAGAVCQMDDQNLIVRARVARPPVVRRYERA